MVGSIAAVVFVIWGIALATSKQSPVNLILWGVIATVAWTGATSRIEMRSDALCIVNIATVAYVAAADITRVDSRPSVMVVTKDYSYGSTLFSASLSGRASGYVAWDAAADRIQNWLDHVERHPARVTTRQRMRWEVAVYFVVFTACFLIIRAA